MNRIVIDTETTNGLENPIVYDIAWQIIDKNYQPIESRRYLIHDVWSCRDLLMDSSYYKKKLRAYFEEIEQGTLQVISLAKIRKQFVADCKKYQIKQVWAYNASFDHRALDGTCEMLSNELLDHFLPNSAEWHCIHALACSTFLNRASFFKFALDHDFITSAGNVRTDAQTAFAYVNTDPNFREAHTALQDVIIERQLLAYGMTRHTKGKTTTPKRDAWSIPQKQFREWQKRHSN